MKKNGNTLKLTRIKIFLVVGFSFEDSRLLRNTKPSHFYAPVKFCRLLEITPFCAGRFKSSLKFVLFKCILLKLTRFRCDEAKIQQNADEREENNDVQLTANNYEEIWSHHHQTDTHTHSHTHTCMASFEFIFSIRVLISPLPTSMSLFLGCLVLRCLH